MLVLRLSRTGRKKLVNYRLVAADSRRAAKGKFVAQLGHYNPHAKNFTFDKEKVEDYIKKGAQPSSTVVKLLKKEKITLPKWAEANLVVKKKASKKKEDAPSPKATEAQGKPVQVAAKPTNAAEPAGGEQAQAKEQQPAEAKPEDSASAKPAKETKAETKAAGEATAAPKEHVDKK